MKAYSELPLGFGIALAENPAAQKKFDALSASEQETMLHEIHSISSKQEMQAFVAGFAGRQPDNIIYGR